MSAGSLPDRIGRALHPRYQVERELSAATGTALFLANDLSLKRPVAVKVVDRALAGEAVARRFQREARILAGLTHPNIVAIHDIQERDGLLYYVRDFLPGEPLSRRLEKGRLPPREVVRLGLDLLGALGVAHRSGVIHRDLRPDNIISLPDRFVVADFGLAISADSTRSHDAGPLGSARSWVYAPPEHTGDEITARGDIYSVGAIFYQALTGRLWPGGSPSGWTRWVGVPFRTIRPLRRALAPKPSDRWPDAPSFARALEEAQTASSGGRRVLTAAAGVILLLGLWIWWSERGARTPSPIPRELAILPFESADGGDDGADIAHLLQLNLDNLPNLSLTSARRVNRWWARRGRAPIAGEMAEAARELRAHWVTHGLLERQGDSLRVRVSLYDVQGRVTVLPEIRAHQGDLGGLSDTLAVTLVRYIAPQLAGAYRVVGDLGDVPLPALRQFLRGDAAFQRDQWALAEQHFQAALAVDSSFALAAWRLANVKSWRRLPTAEELRPLYQRERATLRPLDDRLIAALSQSDLRARITQLEQAIAEFPEDAYARLLYGEELLHRGPLVGRTLEEGVRAMAEAIARDSLLALAYDHLVFAAIRQGNRVGAKAMLAQRQRIGVEPSPGDPDVLALSRLAYDERFVPTRARLRRRLLAWQADSAQLDGVARLFRTGVSWFDIPAAQVTLGDMLLTVGEPDSVRRVSAHVGKALALLALGRAGRALAELDRAATLSPGPDARLQRAEWRVLLPALGLPISESDGPARNDLVMLANDSVLGPRAAWALALAAFAAGDTLEGQRWQARLQSLGKPAHDLERFAGAMALAARQKWTEAMTLSDSLEIAMNATQPVDPFARSAFHLLRGHWLLLGAGDTARATREWRWHDNSDVIGWPSGLPQAGEIDGMVGVYARLLRSRLMLRPGASLDDRKAGCALVQRVRELWSNAEPVMRPLLEQATALAQQCPA